MTVKIDLSRDSLLAPHAIDMLLEFYAQEGEVSPQQIFARASEAWSNYKGSYDENLAQRLYDAVSRQWFMFASPVLSNAPSKDGKAKGLPISCFLSYVPDSIEGLINHSSELRYLSVAGGGVGGHWSSVRSVSDVAPGPIPFLHTVDADMTAYRQGKTRKGSYAAYLDVDHPDIVEFIGLRIPTGDSNRKCLNLHNAVNITNDFMVCVEQDLEYELVDPKKGPTGEFLSARMVWEKILETRFRTGEPYLNFIDQVNLALPKPLKDLGLKVHGSNLCNEIHLPTDENRTAVCCLSSLNLSKYDEWKDTSLVHDVMVMLDNVLQYFIDNAPDTIARAKFSAMRSRDIGLGTMGLHEYLQQNNTTFGSTLALDIDAEIFKNLKHQTEVFSKHIATSRGEAPDMVGTGHRFAHKIALAPNANSGIIAGTSPSVEPYAANAFVQRTRSGSFLVKNPVLDKLLTKLGKNTEEVWQSVITNRGSVSHLTFLTNQQKQVFRTAEELDMMDIVTHAGIRQKFIDQGQSINLFFASGCSRSYVNKVHMAAWSKGLKGLYYLRTHSKQRAEDVSKKVERVALEDTKTNVTTVYGKENCPQCNQVKAILEAHNIVYSYIDVPKTNKSLGDWVGIDGLRTFPVVSYNNNIYVNVPSLLRSLKEEPIADTTDECIACHA